jgi:hypothetical protein
MQFAVGIGACSAQTTSVGWFPVQLSPPPKPFYSHMATGKTLPPVQNQRPISGLNKSNRTTQPGGSRSYDNYPFRTLTVRLSQRVCRRFFRIVIGTHDKFKRNSLPASINGTSKNPETRSARWQTTSDKLVSGQILVGSEAKVELAHLLGS